MNRSKHLLFFALIISMFSLACGLGGSVAKKAEEAAEKVAKKVEATVEAAATEVAPQIEQAVEEAGKAAEEAGKAAEEAAQEAQKKAEEAGGKVEEAVEAATEGEVEEASLNIGSIDASLEKFDSYRTKITMNFDGTDSNGEKSAGKIDMLTEHIKDPPAMHISMAMDGAATGQEDSSMSMEMYTVDNMSYMYNSEMGWMSFPAEDDTIFSSGFFSADDMLSDMPKSARRSLLPQTVNGISTWHYTFDENDFKDSDMMIEFASGEIWIARDEGYPVKMLIEVTGKEVTGAGSDALFEQGSFTLEYELMDVNSSFTITAPEDALGGGGSSIDLPMMDDADVQLSMEGMTSYYTDAGVQDTADFYKSELAGSGWTIDDSFEMIDENSAMLNFKKGNIDLNLIISKETDGRVNVSLLSTEQ